MIRNDIHGRHAPDWAREVLGRFGVNPYGEPHFRMVWGPARTYIIGGLWPDGKIEYRRVPKYGSDQKWILERWRAAVHYGTPEQWASDTMTPEGMFAIGPFPVYGEYESCEVFSTGKGPLGYVPLESGLIEMAARAVLMGQQRSYWDIRQNLADEYHAKEQEANANFDATWEERQHAHKGGLVIGAHAKYNQQEEIEDYERRILKAKAWIDASRFRPGFDQRSH